jgi:hypothetical protein
VTVTDGTADAIASLELVLQGAGADDAPPPDYGSDPGEVVPDLLVPTFDENGDEAI